MMSGRTLVGLVCMMAVVAAGCSDESSSAGSTTTVSTTTTTIPATTTTVAPTTTSTTSTTTTSTTMPPATTTTIAKVKGLPLSASGLGDALFDADADGVVDYVNSILGIPTTDSGWVDATANGIGCPGTVIRFVDWNDLSLFFTDDLTAIDHFAAYTYGPAFGANISPYGLATDAGIGVGSSVAELRAAYPTVNIAPEDEFSGPSFQIEAGLRGVLTGTDDADVILSFVGGVGCGE
ncbi:MAG TPA: hypothetical protein PK020_08485 [Ilumatobacteraceae bacterium]|nr:hypothetical protein [Ilumatobacteraceae bacterium]